MRGSGGKDPPLLEVGSSSGVSHQLAFPFRRLVQHEEHVQVREPFEVFQSSRVFPVNDNLRHCSSMPQFFVGRIGHNVPNWHEFELHFRTLNTSYPLCYSNQKKGLDCPERNADIACLSTSPVLAGFPIQFQPLLRISANMQSGDQRTLVCSLNLGRLLPDFPSLGKRSVSWYRQHLPWRVCLSALFGSAHLKGILKDMA